MVRHCDVLESTVNGEEGLTEDRHCSIGYQKELRIKLVIMQE
jgi:hypothetical protein